MHSSSRAVALVFVASLGCGPTKPATPPESTAGDGGADSTFVDDGTPPDGLSRSFALLQGGEQGARTVLEQFLAENADHASLTSGLRPTAEDYTTLFDPESAQRIGMGQAKAWDTGKVVIKPKPGQKELKLWSATGTELTNGSGNAKEFPPEYQRFAEHLAPSVLLFRFKFVEPGKDNVSAYDGLAFVNSRWVIVPRPWRALEGKPFEMEDADKSAPPPKAKPHRKGKKR